MSGTPPLAKFDSPVAMANLARSYRVMARLMVTQKSRDALLRMAVTLEEKSRTILAKSEAGDFEAAKRG